MSNFSHKHASHICFRCFTTLEYLRHVLPSAQLLSVFISEALGGIQFFSVSFS